MTVTEAIVEQLYRRLRRDRRHSFRGHYCSDLRRAYLPACVRPRVVPILYRRARLYGAT
jgi:hypothetical protein